MHRLRSNGRQQEHRPALHSKTPTGLQRNPSPGSEGGPESDPGRQASEIRGRRPLEGSRLGLRRP